MSSYPSSNSHHGESLRPSPTGVHPHSGSYPEQGRTTTLPPLTTAFPITDPPGPTNYPYPTQQRSTPIPIDQHYHPPPQPQTQVGYPGYLHPSYPQFPDTRHSSGQTHSSFNRNSPSPSAAEHRRLPPLNVPREERWQGWSYCTSHADMQMLYPQPSGDTIHSPQALPSSLALGYPQYQSLASAVYPGHSSSRGTIRTTAAVNSSYPRSSHASLDRTMPSSRNSTQHPYSRDDPHITRVNIELPPDPQAEPVIKKRKRSDARQLDVLNATYARTASPSTEERAALAKQLDMSARSVQIWFQNKRQSFRQTRAAANPPPMSMPAPDPTPPSTSSGSGYRGSPGLGSPMVESSEPMYSSRSPPPGMTRSVQTPAHISGILPNDVDLSPLPTGLTNTAHCEEVHTAISLLCKEMLQLVRSTLAGLGTRDEQIETRMGALARLERGWEETGVYWEEREQKAFTGALRDGYVLCQFMNKLRPGSIEWIHPLEDGASNVKKFLNSCFAHRLPREDVFLYDDLIDATPDSLARVARTIIALVKLAEKPPSTHSLLLQTEGNVELDGGSSILPLRSRVTGGAGDSPHLRSLGLSADGAITHTVRDRSVSPPMRSWSISSSRRNQSASPSTMNPKGPPSMKNQRMFSFSKDRTISPSTKNISPSTNMSTSPSPNASPNLSPLASISANISPSPNMFTSPLPNPLMAPDLVDTSISKSVRPPRMSWRRIRQIFSPLPARHPGISETPHANPVLHSVGGHSFVDATFRKPVICRVCMESMRKAAALCSRCCLVAHSKCIARVPWGCST